ALDGRFGANHRFLLDQLLAQLDHGATLIGGVDMTRFASSAHLASWARVCPGTHESAGKRRPAGAGFSRRRGSKRAAPAIAHRLLVIACHVLRDRVAFADLGADYFDRLNATRAK